MYKRQVLPGALVQFRQLGGEGGQPRGEILGRQPLPPHRVQGIARAQQRLPGPLHRGGEPGELRLGLAEQRRERVAEPVQLLPHPDQFVLGGGQLTPRPGGRRGLQIVPVEIMRVDGLDVALTDLVDPPAQRLEVVARAPRGGGVVDGRDRLDGDPEVPLSSVEFVERGRRGVLGSLRLGALALRTPPEPAPGAAARERGRQRQRGKHRQGHQDEGVTDRTGGPSGCRRHIPLPCCGSPCVESPFSHLYRTNTRAGQFAVRTVTFPSEEWADTACGLLSSRGTDTDTAPSSEPASTW